MYDFQVKGMTCGHCVKSVTRALKEVDEKADVRVDLAQGRVQVDSAAPAGKLSAAITEAGYEVLAAR